MSLEDGRVTEEQLKKLAKLAQQFAPDPAAAAWWGNAFTIGAAAIVGLGAIVLSGGLAIGAVAGVVLVGTTAINWGWFGDIAGEAIAEYTDSSYTNGGKNDFVNHSFYDMIASFVSLDEDSEDKTYVLANNLISAAEEYSINDRYIGFLPFDPRDSDNREQIVEDLRKDASSNFMVGAAIDILRENKEIVYAEKVGTVLFPDEGLPSKTFNHDSTKAASFGDAERSKKRFIFDKIIKLVESKDARTIINNKLIATIIQNGYTFEDFNIRVGETLNERIKSKYAFEINLPQYQWLLAIAHATNDGNVLKIQNNGANANGNLYPKDAQKGVRVRVINSTPAGRDESFNTNIFNLKINWPASIQDSEGYDKLVEDFNVFSDIILSSYEFKSKTTFGVDSFGDFVAGSLRSIFGIEEGEYYEKKRAPSEFVDFLMRQKYIEFITNTLADSEDDNKLDTTIGNHFKNSYLEDSNNKNFLDQLLSVFVIDKELIRRVELFKLLENLENEDQLTPELLADVEKKSIDAWTSGQFSESATDISEVDLNSRQKFFKQCALMLNIDELSEKYREVINKKYKDSVPFDGRFIMAGCSSNQETLISKLVSSSKEQELFELKPYQMSEMVPKIRLFKVYESGDNKGIKEVEFLFDRESKIDRSPSETFMSAEIDKGSGVGLKEFSFEFNGTNPAEARNDIKANLTLFFQSFVDFIRWRWNGRDKFRYVDLVMQPSNRDNSPYGVKLQSGRHYDPMFYRIRAEVGYYTPDSASADLRDAIRSSNKSFFLTMVDHDISFSNDGSVTVSISYRAYMESLLQHPKMDALASPELIAKREANETLFLEQIQKKECTNDQIRELQISLQAQEEVLIKQSLSSIIKRLMDRDVIYSALVNRGHKDFFSKHGYFKECDLEYGSTDEEDITLIQVLKTELPEKSDDFDFIDSGSRAISFFYFGDLLYTILDCIYVNESTPRYGLDNIKIILGSFEFSILQSKAAQVGVYNIAELPISIDFFSRWFVDNVTSQKDTRKSFPVLRFIRTLSDQLVRKSLIENCVDKKITSSLRFQTGQVTAYDSEKEPLINTAKNSLRSGNIAINVDNNRGAGKELPLNGGGASDSTKVENYYNYIVLAAVGSSLSFSGSGNYWDDIDQSRFHIHVGQDSGLVKSISLTKSDQQYIREARFAQNGINGFSQLAAVYIANIEMYGNTIFYPGMEFFFNPYGLGGGADFGIPQEKDSIANQLGIGGYHTIISVKSKITPGKFTTSISGQQYFSGAEEDREGNMIRKKNYGQNIEEYSADNKNESACNDVILEVQNYQFEDEEVENSNNSVQNPQQEIVEVVGPVNAEVTVELNEAAEPNVLEVDSDYTYYVDDEVGERIGTLTVYDDGTSLFTYFDDDNVQVFVRV